MKVVRVHAPGADEAVGRSIESAVRAFNASLDIRLRFLSIGIEERVLRVADAEAAAEQVAAALAASGGGPGADVLVLLGGSEAAVAAAAAAARSHVPVLRVGAGERTGRDADAARSVDHMASIAIVHGPACAAALRDEGVAADVEDVGDARGAALGEHIVRVLSRARRRGPC